MAENTRRRRTDAEPADPQVQTTDELLELFEVLVEARNGHRSVHRVQAKDRSAAEKSVAETLDQGAVVVAAARAGPGSEGESGSGLLPPLPLVARWALRW